MKEFLEKLLTIIGYNDDKDAFISDFIAVCAQKTLFDYLNTLSEEEGKLVTQEMLLANDEYAKLFQKNLTEQLESYLEEMMPILSDEQLESVDALVKTFASQDASASSSA